MYELLYYLFNCASQRRNFCYAVFKMKSGDNAIKKLRNWANTIDDKGNFETMQEVYGNYNIGLVRMTGVLPALFGEMFNRVNGMFFTSIGDMVVFANQASSLRTFIDEYEKRSLLITGKQFIEIKKSLPQQGNHFFFVRPAASFYIYKSVANSEWRSKAD